MLSFSVEESFVLHFAIRGCKNEMHRTLLLPVFMYGCETWSLTLRKEREGVLRIVC
jgi:hypothetical protein